MGQNSTNSSRPPSSDLPGSPSPAPKSPSGRKRGGQPGHEKRERKLLPPERVGVRPPTANLRHVVGAVRLFPVTTTSPFGIRSLISLRVIAKVVEFRLHSLCCEHCNITTRASLPAGVPTSPVGPRLQAMMAVCAGSYHLSKRMIEELVSDFFGVDISLGSISNLERETSEAIAEPVKQAVAHVQQQPVVHADETGWTEAKKKAWLWTAIAGNVAVFLIRKSRGADVARELLGHLFSGILNSDRWGAYNWVRTRCRQLCWAHLIRHFKMFEDHGPKAKMLGLALQAQCDLMFANWHRVRDGTLERSSFREYMRPIRREILRLLRSGVDSSSAKVATKCREILKLEAALFTFVRVVGVEPTNNVATRGSSRSPLAERMFWYG